MDQPIGQYFDLIVGTSTGGIIALGLGMGFSARELLKFYEMYGPNIFGVKQKRKCWQRVKKAKYDHDELKKALEKQFGEKKLGNSKTRLVIPAFNMDIEEVNIFKTSHHERFQLDFRKPVVDVALATSAAPPIFQIHRESSGTSFIDGGVFANNPTGLAVVEAIGVLEWKPDELLVLSLGCTSTPLTVDVINKQDMRIGDWGLQVIEAMMKGQSSASIGTAKLLMRKPSQLVRVDFKVDTGRYSLDALSGIDLLKGLGESKARTYLPELKPLFFGVAAEKFVPYHKLEDTV